MADRVTGRAFATRSEVLARRGMAATSQPLATQVALDMLKRDGTAVDAAIAANAVLGLVEPTGCGLGGDLFAIVWEASTGSLHGLNASGRSPRALHASHFEELGLERVPSRGPLSVSVPGAVDGWFELHARFGRLPMAGLLEPAAVYARDGFPVSEVIADAWASEAKVLASLPGFADTFLPGGAAPAKGEVFRNPGLARTLTLIAEGGREAFYQGDTAETVARTVGEAGGFLSREDLAAHQSEWVEPVSSSYRGYELWELPPNGQGIAALQILNLMEGFDVAALGEGSAELVHRFVEAKKLAYADRARYYADPDFSEVPVAALVSKRYADERRKLIDPDIAALEVEAGAAELDVSDTVYLTTADARGNMVSLIQSNFRGMGSGVCPHGLGFGLQSRGELFALAPHHANAYAPGKRPFHTIIPAFVTVDGRPFLSFGVMGGDIQPQMHAQILMNIVDFGMSFQEAGDAPRILHSGSSDPTGVQMRDGGTVHLESGFSRECRRSLIRRGHRLEEAVGPFGGYQAIGIDEHGTYYGASESRKDGQAAGY